ncbi:MAG: hypothetical protein KDF59_03130 [Nitrosomonas sp.]|nr:hypothetical protein [Nitrosomonas sp.]
MSANTPNSLVIHEVAFTERFKRAYKSLPQDIQKQVNGALHSLMKNPRPASIRFEKLKGYRKPNIFTIHATSNHSHKVSFELDGTLAILRNVGTHKLIDRNP